MIPGSALVKIHQFTAILRFEAHGPPQTRKPHPTASASYPHDPQPCAGEQMAVLRQSLQRVINGTIQARRYPDAGAIRPVERVERAARKRLEVKLEVSQKDAQACRQPGIIERRRKNSLIN